MVAAAVPVSGADWPRFRGPGGAGISADTGVPVEWSDSKNLTWKVSLPGPGSSSPIIVGDRVFVTCYSGYGTSRDDVGNLDDLRRHLLCVDRNDGKTIWTKTVDAILPEDPFSGIGIPNHGYASNTPVSDGQRVYVFFGKTGVLAFDMDGNQLWHVDVGHESSRKRWGSAASLILYKNTVIFNAAEESRTIRALDRSTGKEVWNIQADGLELTYATPLIVDLDNGEQELVIGVPFEVWGLNPDTGNLNWYALTSLSGNIAPSPIAEDGIVYVFGGFPQTGTLAIRSGGKDKNDVTDTHVLWTSRDSSYVPSPVVHDGNLYCVNDQGIAYCMDAKTGETIYGERMPRLAGGGRMDKPFYASVVLAGDKLYAVSRTSGTFVLPAKPQFEVIAQNRFESDDTNFDGSPAISGGQMFLRSNRCLYCVALD